MECQYSNKCMMVSAKSRKASQGQYFFRRYNLKYLSQLAHYTIVVSCVFLLMVQSKTCLERYLSKDTRAVLKVEPTGDATFLAFTICPAYEHAYKLEVLEKLGKSRTQIRDGNFTLNGLDWITDKVFERVTHDFNDVIEQIIVKTEDKTQSKVTLTMADMNTKQVEMKTMYGLTLGRCFSVELMPNLTSLEIVTLEFVGKMDFYVYFHHPQQFLDKDTKTKVHVKLGVVSFLDLAYELTENTLLEESLIPCNSSEEYNYDNCHYKKLKQKLMEKVGCFVPSIPPNEYKDGSVCMNMTAKEMKDMKDYFSRVAAQRHCVIPCKTMEVFLGLLANGDGSEDRSYIKLYIKSTVKYKKSVRDYTFLNMVAEIGGYEGLLLGIAIVSITGWVKKYSDNMV